MFRTLVGSCFVVALLFMQTTASAETLEIQYTGLDISYDGSTISDIGDPDDLSSVDFFADLVKVLGLNLPGDSPLQIDLNVPGVTLPKTGGTVLSAAGGSLYLTFPGGDHLDLTLGQASVTYVNASSVNIYFLLAGGAASMNSQSLPPEVNGVFGEMVAVSFSTNVTPASLTDDGTNVTAFVANGTGEIEGTLTAVPEPSTITLLLCGLASLICWRRRK